MNKYLDEKPSYIEKKSTYGLSISDLHWIRSILKHDQMPSPWDRDLLIVQIDQEIEKSENSLSSKKPHQTGQS